MSYTGRCNKIVSGLWSSTFFTYWHARSTFERKTINLFKCKLQNYFQ